MTKKIKVSFLAILIALLALGGIVSGDSPSPSGDMELTELDTAELDIIFNVVYRTGTPDLDLALQIPYEVGGRNLIHMSDLIRGAGVHPAGYFLVFVSEENWDVIHNIVDEIQRMVGEDAPIAVGLHSPPQLDEATRKTICDTDWSKLDRYRIGTPDYDLVRRFHEEFDVRNLKYSADLIVAAGPRCDGYYCLTIKEENWDAIHHTVREIQQIMGEDFPIAVGVGAYRRYGTTAVASTTTDETVATASDVFGGHWCTIQKGLLYQGQTLSFAAISIPDGEVGMVLSGHWKEEVMPVNAWVYSPKSWYPLPTNRIGIIDRVGGVYSDTSYMSPAWPGGDRITPGVLHNGDHIRVWTWLDTFEGLTISKTGRTTGTTSGEVIGFIDINHPDHGWLLDQAVATFDAAFGDSGSPVYKYFKGGTGYQPFTYLFGVFHGEYKYEGNFRPVFSTMSQVIDDLDIEPVTGP